MAFKRGSLKPVQGLESARNILIEQNRLRYSLFELRAIPLTDEV